ncbi:MAG: HAD family hydrolase [Planctomycetota bacterium]
MRTLLFDIDGTLVNAGGAGARAMRRALQEEFELDQPKLDIQFGGRTDRGLIAEILRSNRLPDDSEGQDRFQASYEKHLPRELPGAGGRVLPGVEALLSQLSQLPSLRIAVMTGNLESMAVCKLQHFCLLHHVEWIVGGDHDHQRDDLARRAANKMVDRHGRDAVNDVVVIGDTPADIRCADAIGAKSVAVCTGGWSSDQLRVHQPDEVFEDLGDVDTVVSTLTRGVP